MKKIEHSDNKKKDHFSIAITSIQPPLDIEGFKLKKDLKYLEMLSEENFNGLKISHISSHDTFEVMNKVPSEIHKFLERHAKKWSKGCDTILIPLTKIYY